MRLANMVFLNDSGHLQKVAKTPFFQLYQIAQASTIQQPPQVMPTAHAPIVDTCTKTVRQHGVSPPGVTVAGGGLHRISPNRLGQRKFAIEQWHIIHSFKVRLGSVREHSANRRPSFHAFFSAQKIQYQMVTTEIRITFLVITQSNHDRMT